MPLPVPNQTKHFKIVNNVTEGTPVVPFEKTKLVSLCTLSTLFSLQKVPTNAKTTASKMIKTDFGKKLAADCDSSPNLVSPKLSFLKNLDTNKFSSILVMATN